MQSDALGAEPIILPVVSYSFQALRGKMMSKSFKITPSMSTTEMEKPPIN